MQQPAHTPRAGDQQPPGEAGEPLDELRAELTSIREQPVAARVARFEHANVVLAAALAELDEV